MDTNAHEYYFFALFLMISAVIAVAGSSCRAEVSGEISPPSRPNILFILADDLGWKDLTCYGSDYYETPNIDALARSGMRFTNAYAASPLCSPTRASILTGQEPGRLRFTTPSGHLPQAVLDPKETSTAAPFHKAATPQTRTRLPNEYITFAEVLKEHGYKTGFMGKWHLGRAPYIPENQGFDVVVGGREHPGPPPPGHFFAPWNCDTLPVVPEGTHICDALTDQAIGFLEKNRDKPFLLCLWYYDVHAPYQAKEELKQYYSNKLGPNHIQRSPTMGAMIGNFDTNVGRVIGALKDLGLENDTIVIFTSDNGGNMYDGPDGVTPTNNSPLRAGKGNNYEGGVRVPLIIRVPGMTRPGSTSDVVTSTVDHYASLLEMLEIPLPENQVTDGQSYVRALHGEFYERAPIFSTFCHNVPATGNRANISMRQGPWRFYTFFFDGAGQEHRYELYNLDEDIGETRNLAAARPEIVASMNAAMEAHIKEAGILLPRKNERYAGNVAAGWLGSSDTEIGVEGKMLSIEASGPDPSVETVYTPNIQNAGFILEFDMKSDSAGPGEVQWKHNGENQGSPVHASKFTPVHDGKWHGYKVPFTLTGTLNTLIIQPSQGPGFMQLRNIRITTRDGYVIRKWELY